LDSIPVKHSALSLISDILKRALKTVDHCLDKETWQDSDVYTAEMMEEFVQLFREALGKVGSGPGLNFHCRPPSPSTEERKSYPGTLGGSRGVCLLSCWIERLQGVSCHSTQEQLIKCLLIDLT
jgi:hypothetical protein